MDELEFTLYKVSRKEVVLQQDTRCNHLYVLLKGELEVNIIDVAGNLVKVEEIIAPRAFATPHLFGENNILPATFTVSKDSILLMATRTSVFKLISSVPQLLHSFLCVTATAINVPLPVCVSSLIRTFAVVSFIISWSIAPLMVSLCWSIIRYNWQII